MAATRRIPAAVLAVVAAAAVLTGCGGHDDAADAPLVEPAATTADTGPFAGESGDDILSDAMDAMDSLRSVTFDAHMKDDDDQSVHITVGLTDKDRCAAAVVDEAETFQLIGIGETYYLKGDTSYWKQEGGSHGGTLARTFAGRWARLPAKAADDFDDICHLDAILTPDSDHVTKGPATTVYGRRVVPLHDREDDGAVTSAYVATTGKPYVLGFGSSDASYTGRFSGFGKALKISAPPAGDTVDLSSEGDDVPDLSV